MYIIVYSSIICNSQTGKPPKCPSREERLNKWYYIHAVEYHIQQCHCLHQLEVTSVLSKEARYKNRILRNSIYRMLKNRHCETIPFTS